MVNPYLFPDWRGSLAAFVKTRKLCEWQHHQAPSYKTLLMSKIFRASVQGLDTLPPELFSFIAAMNARCRARMRKRRKAMRVVEGDVSKGEFLIHPFLCSGEVSNRPTLSLRSDRQSRKKKRSGRSRENFLSGSFVTRTLLYIHEGFVSA